MPIKPLAGLTRTLRGLLIANVAVSIAAVLASLYSYAEYSALPEGAALSDEYLASDTVAGLVALVWLGLFVAVAVVFLMWLYRASKNLRTLSGTAMRFTPGWTVGWFFIPILCVFKPYQAVKEIWLVSHRRREPLLLGDKGAGGRTALVGWWWFFFVFAKVVSQVANSWSWQVVDVEGYLTSVVLDAVSSGVDAVGYAVTLLLVLRIAAAYAANIDESRALAAAAGPVSVAGSMWPGAAAAAAGVAPGAARVAPGAAGAVLAAGYAGAAGAIAPPAALPPAAWHPDPIGRHQLRWWDGAEWTEYVGDLGVMSEDPV